MALFSKDRRKEVAALTAERDAREDERDKTQVELAYERKQTLGTKRRHEEAVAVIKNLHEAEKAKLRARHEDELRELNRAHETTVTTMMREISRLEGRIEELRAKGRLLELVREQHEWHRDGSVHVHGREYQVWRCVASECLANVQAQARVMLPVGTQWREVDGDEETTASA